MGLKTQRTTSNVKHSFDHVALVATAFLFILGFILPPTIPWQLAALTLFSAAIYALVRKVRLGQQIKVLSAGASSQAPHGGRGHQRSR
jgi:hypothetical protein